MGTRHRRRHPNHDQVPGRPLSVWVTGQRDPATDLIERGYHIDTAADADRVPPAVAERVIHAYCPPRGIVLDPDCGAGTVLVEALRAGRSAIGLTARRGWRNLAAANVNAVRCAGVVADGMALVASAAGQSLRTARAAGVSGQVDLMLTSLRGHAAGATPELTAARVRALLERTRPLIAAWRAGRCPRPA